MNHLLVSTKDNDKLLKTLKDLRGLGNTVIVVEHDEDTILASDHIVDVGPGAGDLGGKIVYSGEPIGIKENKSSLTGQYISVKKEIKIPKKRVKFNNKKVLQIFNATLNNLKNINVNIPVGLMTCVTGVSGSGKSSLINNVLFEYIYNDFLDKDNSQVACQKVEGLENIDKIIEIDQSLLVRLQDLIQRLIQGYYTYEELFSQTPETRGYKAGRFSFNVRVEDVRLVKVMV